MPEKPIPSSSSKVERDPDLFVWFMTLVVVGMYATTLYSQPATRQLGTLIPFTILVLVHLALHWRLGKILEHSSRIVWYIVVQGVLALVISLIAKNLGMGFALFMALLGEAIGFYGLNRWGLLAGVYYLILLGVSLFQISGWASSLWGFLGILPIALFVVIYVSLYMRQVEAREQAQSLSAKLESANRQLAEYAAQVKDLTIANERQRMARELHDTLAQGVAGLVLQLEAVKAHLASGREERGAAIIDQALVRARNTLADSRAAIDDLRSTSSNLPESIREKTECFTQATGIPCELDLSLDESSAIPGGADEHTLRVLSEALANVTRHAQATQVWVAFDIKDDQLNLEIRDNGKGFDPDAATRSGHYGLLGMRERARLAGGTLTLQSHLGEGTRVKLHIPTSPEGLSS